MPNQSTLSREQSSSERRDRSGPRRRPRLGFVGIGWIGLHRMQKLIEADLAEVAVLADASDGALEQGLKAAPAASTVGTLEEVLDAGVDGVVIATPSALHTAQARGAIERGLAVFCQKPLGRTRQETHDVVAAAWEHDCLLGVDFSYRHVRGVAEMRRLIHSGALGEIFLIDLTFHNAYGPDKAWFYDPQLAGGGCVTDLGIHLIDLADWLLGKQEHLSPQGALWHRGRVLSSGEESVVEDAAIAQWEYAGGAKARLACSWHLSAGQDAVIEASFYGTEGAVALRNVHGSFYDFVVEHRVGTRREILAEPPDEWGGRALVSWAEQLSCGNHFDPAIEDAVAVAELIDGIYGR